MFEKPPTSYSIYNTYNMYMCHGQNMVQYIILIVLMVIHPTTRIQKHHGYVNSHGPPMISSPQFCQNHVVRVRSGLRPRSIEEHANTKGIPCLENAAWPGNPCHPRTPSANHPRIGSGDRITKKNTRCCT